METWKVKLNLQNYPRKYTHFAAQVRKERNSGFVTKSFFFSQLLLRADCRETKILFIIFIIIIHF